MLEVKTNFEALKKLGTNLPGLLSKLVAEVSKQTVYFVGDIQRRQMSGRRGDIYLNVDTGNLRRSWFSKTSMENGDITTSAYTNVKYAAIHQYGGTIRRSARESILSFRRGRGKFVKPSKAHFQQRVSTKAGEIRIPKRLFIEEEFERQMPDRYQKACLKTMLEAFK